MIKYIKISTFCLLTFVSNLAFGSIIDSLKCELKKAKEDTNKVKLLNEIANFSYDINKYDTRKFALKSYTLSEKLHYIEGQVNGLNLIGLSYYGLGDYDKAITYNKKALLVGRNLKVDKLTGVYIDLANVYSAQSNNANAILYFHKAYKVYEQRKDYHNIAMVYMNLALEYKLQKNFEKAIEYNIKALKIYEKLRDTLSIIKVSNNLGGVYLSIGMLKKAEQTFLTSLKQSEKLNYDLGITNSCLFLGIIYQQNSKQSKLSIYYIHKSISWAKKINDQFQIAINQGNLAKTYSNINQLDSAIYYLKKANMFFIENRMINEQMDVYFQLNTIHKQKNSFKEALFYFEKYDSIKDVIYNEINAQKVNDALTKYETEKKEKEIVLLNTKIRNKKKDQEILNAKIKNRNNIILGVSSVFVLLLITLYLLYTKRQLVLKNIHQEELNSQRNLTTKAIVQAQEKEQTRIAKDLHDSIGTFLSTLKINLQLFHEFIPKPKVEIYKNALNLIDQISAELRNIMRNLSNEVLNNQGVCHAINELIEQINELNTAKIDFHVVGEIQRLDENTEHNLYRITQELFNNCIKYAHAKSVSLQLIEEEKTIVLMYEDDGVGFDVSLLNDLNPKHGMGLKNIKNRVHFLEGTIHIESTPDSGTVFIIEVPKKYV